MSVLRFLDPGLRPGLSFMKGRPRLLASKRIVLHFEHFVCDGDGTYCTASGCLHQVYVSTDGHYRLLRSYYAPAGD
jgi:hypothetical protein